MEYEITVTVGDHSPQVDVSGLPPHGTYVITGSEDYTTRDRALILPGEPGRPMLRVRTDQVDWD